MNYLRQTGLLHKVRPVEPIHGRRRRRPLELTEKGLNHARACVRVGVEHREGSEAVADIGCNHIRIRPAISLRKWTNSV